MATFSSEGSSLPQPLPVTDPPPSAPGRVSRFTLVGLPIAVFGLNIAVLPPVIVALALKVNEVVGQTAAPGVLGAVLGVGALFALVANPLAGRLSDRRTGRFGMRRPFMIGGVVLGFVALVLISAAAAPWLLIVGWALAQIGFNFAQAALLAVLPDQVPIRLRGRMAALVGVSQSVAVVVGLFLVQLFHTSAMQMLVPGALGLVVVVLYASLLKDRVLPERPQDRLGVVKLLGSFVFNPRRNPDLGWAWLTRFLLTSAQATALTYLAYFLIQDLGIPATRVATSVFLATLVNTGGSLLVTFVAGYLSDRLRRRKVFVLIAALVGVVGLTTIGFSHDLATVLIGELIMGIGIGSFYAVDLALITDVLKTADDNGKDLGVVNIAQALPQSLVPAAAPAVIGAVGYPGLFITGAVVGLLGAVSVVPVRSVR